MITPNGVTSSAYWNAIKAGNPTHVRITFLGQDIVLTEADIDINAGIFVMDVLNGDTDLVFGRAVCKQVSTTILNSDNLNGLIWTGEFQLEMGVEISGSTKWVTIGYFTGEKPKNVTTVETIEFIAYDRMTRFDILADDFVKSITYPATLQTIYNNLCSFVGITKVAGNELANIMNRSFSSAPAEMIGYTCRDILAWIAEACGCYAKIDNQGRCKMVWFVDNTSHAVTANEEFSVETADIHAGLTWDEADTYTWDELDNMTWNDVCGYAESYSIDQILVKQLGNDLDINYPYPYGGNVYMIVENPFLQIGSAAQIASYIKPIYDRLVAFGGYLPVNLQCVGNWCVEAGDIITISVMENNISFPIFCKTMRWNSAINDEYETTGNNERVVYTSEKTKQRVLENNKIELYVSEAKEEIDQNYYKIRSGIAIQPEGVEISGGKYINIKSGSSFKVESGGNIDINGSGNLKLIGSTVEIKSGSTFDVEANNIVVDSNLGRFVVKKLFGPKNFYFGIGGLTLAEAQDGLNGVFSPYMTTTIRSNHETYNAYCMLLNINDNRSVEGIRYNTRITFGTEYVVIPDATTFAYIQSLRIKSSKYVGSSSTPEDEPSFLFVDNIYLTNKVWAPHGQYDDVRTGIVYYVALIQESSKDIKHNIQNLPSVGDKLDHLKPVTFVYDNDEKEQQRMGLIYEDTVEVMPEICTDDESNKAINYMELIPALLKEIQDLRKRVATLENELN